MLFICDGFPPLLFNLIFNSAKLFKSKIRFPLHFQVLIIVICCLCIFDVKPFLQIPDHILICHTLSSFFGQSSLQVLDFAILWHESGFSIFQIFLFLLKDALKFADFGHVEFTLSTLIFELVQNEFYLVLGKWNLISELSVFLIFFIGIVDLLFEIIFKVSDFFLIDHRFLALLVYLIL